MKEDGPKKHTVETTLGDLICAISEAVNEVQEADREVALLTHLILGHILDHYQEDESICLRG